MRLYSYYVGVDLGSRQDFTAITVLEELVWISSSDVDPNNWACHYGIKSSGWVSPAELTNTQAEAALSANYHGGKPKDVPLQIRHLERLPLGTSYPKVVFSRRARITSKGLRVASKGLMLAPWERTVQARPAPTVGA